MKNVYQLDVTGLLVGTAIADESPLEPGVYLLPAGCVDAEPLPHMDGKLQRFSNGAFHYEDPPKEPEPAPLTAEQIWERIKAERDRRKAGGVKVGDYWFHSDDSSRIQQIGLKIFGAQVPPVPWKTMSGAFVPMTEALAASIFDAVAANDVMIFQKAEEHRAAMEAAADPASYDFSTGWPKVYGEE